MMRNIISFILLFSVLSSSSQILQGHIYGSDNEIIIYANIYIKHHSGGTSSDNSGYYFIQFDEPGVYNIVVSSIGYKTKEFEIILDKNLDLERDIWLEYDNEELEEIIVNSKSRDPAYGIIRKAIEHRSRWDNQFQSLGCDVYIKAVENISEKERKKRKKIKDQEENNKSDYEKYDDDKIEESDYNINKNRINKIAGSMNMVEIQLKRHFQFPDQIKEIRTAYKKYGNTEGLCFINTVENDFNYYDNVIRTKNINETPIISPLHITSVLTYKFKLISTSFIYDHLLYEIKVTPRKRGNSTWEGKIWIIDDLFSLHKTDLSLDKNGLVYYKAFRLIQEYDFDHDSVLLVKQQNFEYISKIGKQKLEGLTQVKYDNFIINQEYPKRFFNNELGITTKEAYEKDTAYWEENRKIPLTDHEKYYQHIKDSIHSHINSQYYLDSVDSVYNRITFLDIIWDGPGFSNRYKKKHWRLSSIAGIFDPFEIGGIRLGPDISYFKKWKNEKTFFSFIQGNVGIRNPDLKYMVWLNHRYDPKHAGYINLYFGDQNELIVENDALTNLFQRSNWIREFNIEIQHSRELLNGLYFETYLNWIERSPITSYQFNPEADNWFNGNHPIYFDLYQEFILTLGLKFIPFQKYMSEPYRKVVLGSKWPRISLYYEKGMPGILNSAVDFDFFTASIDQSFKLSTFGTSKYKIEYGKFLRNIKSYYADYKIFPRGDKWFFASLMESMQIQDTTLSVTNSYIQIHFAHHFNGAIINYLPLIKKLGIHSVIGASLLSIPESKYNYQELFFGVERIFRIQRSRLRIGIYFVTARSTHSDITPRIKFAINRYTYRDQSWGY